MKKNNSIIEAMAYELFNTYGKEAYDAFCIVNKLKINPKPNHSALMPPCPACTSNNVCILMQIEGKITYPRAECFSCGFTAHWPGDWKVEPINVEVENANK